MTASGGSVRTPYHYGDGVVTNRNENFIYNVSSTDEIFEMDTSIVKDSSNNDTLMLAILVVVGTILIILVLIISVFLCRKVTRHCLRLQCHVCLERIDRRMWDNHRTECQQANNDFLKSLPEPFDIRCQKCLAYLKLMPKVSRFLNFIFLTFF